MSNMRRGGADEEEFDDFESRVSEVGMCPRAHAPVAVLWQARVLLVASVLLYTPLHCTCGVDADTSTTTSPRQRDSATVRRPPAYHRVCLRALSAGGPASLLQVGAGAVRLNLC
jgi:hypothetical protein